MTSAVTSKAVSTGTGCEFACATVGQRDRAHLTAILDYARTARRFEDSWDRDCDTEDLRSFLAICQCLKVIGGAAGQVSSEVIPPGVRLAWPRLIEMRDQMTTGYRTVTEELVSVIVRTDLPPLISALSDALEERRA